MPDHREETTGTVRGRRASGRHRTDRPERPAVAAGAPTPEVGFPVVHDPGPGDDRPRHARNGERAPHPPEPQPDARPDRYGRGASENRNGARSGSRDGDGALGSRPDWNGPDWNGTDRTGAEGNGARANGGWIGSERNGAAGGAGRRSAGRNGSHRNGAIPDGERGNGGWTGADRHGADRHSADRHSDDRHSDDRHSPDWNSPDWNSDDGRGDDWQHADDRTDQHDGEWSDGSRYGAWHGAGDDGPSRADRNGAERNGDRRRAASGRRRRYRDDAYPDDAYPDDAHAAEPYVQDPPTTAYEATPHEPPTERVSYAERPGPADGDRSDRPPPRSRTRPPAADDRYEPAPHPPRPADEAGAADREPRGRPGGPARARPGPRDAPPSPAAPVPPPPTGLPARRPGDPPGAPAELFVETTAETAALTPEVLGAHDEAKAREPAPAEEPEAQAAADAPPTRPRVLGVPLPVTLPGWAARMLPGAGDGAADGSATGHGHGHGHGPARPAGRRVRILIAALLVPCALATLVGLVVLWPVGGPPATAHQGSQEPVRAQVTLIRANDCSPGSGDGRCLAVVVHMADGPRPGIDLVQVVPVEPGTPEFAVGDQVVLSWTGGDPDDAGSYQIVDFQRGTPLAWLAALFAAAVLVLGRWRGLAALAALGLSFVVLLFFVVPAILAGRDPLAVAVVGACLIMFAVLYLTHGPSARTSTAVLGTLLSLGLIGALGTAFSAAAKLTGLDDQTSNLIATLGTGVDARGLLLAGVVIGALGVLDDVTVTQTSAVWELRHANPGMSARGLFAAAMRIGRDHVASAVNTLVLAYAGAALPLLLLFSLSGRGFGDVVTTQDVATEIVRTLVGSIGLVASVPITTALAAAVAARETVPATEKAE